MRTKSISSRTLAEDSADLSLGGRGNRNEKVRVTLSIKLVSLVILPKNRLHWKNVEHESYCFSVVLGTHKLAATLRITQLVVSGSELGSRTSN